MAWVINLEDLEMKPHPKFEGVKIGSAEVFLNETWRRIKEGDVIIISPKEVHGVKAIGEKPLKCYIVHAPALW